MVSKQKAQQVLYDCYGGARIVTDEQEAVQDIAVFHEASTSFLATIDSFGGDGLPEDLSPQTKRYISTTQTFLTQVIGDIEALAQKRLEEVA